MKPYIYTFIAVYSVALTILMVLLVADNERLNAEINVYREKLWNESFAHGATKGEVARLKDDYKYLVKHSAKK